MLQVSPRISAKIRTMEGNGPKDREDMLKYAIQNIIKNIKPPPPSHSSTVVPHCGTFSVIERDYDLNLRFS